MLDRDLPFNVQYREQHQTKLSEIFFAFFALIEDMRLTVLFPRLVPFNEFVVFLLIVGGI